MFGQNKPLSQLYNVNKVEKKLLVTSIFYTIQGEGPFSGRPAVFVRLAKCNLTCSFCYAANTPIRMADGTNKYIQDVLPNDNVISYDQPKKRFSVQRVVAIHRSDTWDMLCLSAGSDKLWLTSNHPLLGLTKDRLSWQEAWIEAGKLSHNNRLLRATAGRLPMRASGVVSEIVTVKSFAPKTVYNLTVENTHTYIANGFVTHNCDTYFDSGDVMSIDEVLLAAAVVRQRYYESRKLPPPFATPLLVVTGGEPLIQAEMLTNLLTTAENVGGWQTQVESNGIFPCNLPVETTLVVSPKINEANGRHIRCNRATLERANALKFVISADQPGYTDVPAYAFAWMAKHGREGAIYLSPMNCYLRPPEGASALTMAERSTAERVSFWTPGLLDNAANQRNHEHAAELAMRYGLRLSLQTHLYAGLP